MECQRCLLGKEAKYRVYTDIIDMKVCETCADEARRLGIAVEPLDDGKVKTTELFAALWPRFSVCLPCTRLVRELDSAISHST
jgi:hypothetical protein